MVRKSSSKTVRSAPVRRLFFHLGEEGLHAQHPQGAPDFVIPQAELDEMDKGHDLTAERHPGIAFLLWPLPARPRRPCQNDALE